ncbi:MAG: VOC family protein [Steroidobacteraceae bacterium]
MANISNLGYVVFQVSDLPAWHAFAVDTLGLMAGHYDAGRSLALRMDQLEQRIVLEQGSDDDLIVAGWELDTERELEEFVARLRQAGAHVTAASREQASQRHVEKLYLLDDPNGYRHEFYFGATVALISNPFRSKNLLGGFRTGRLGVGHILPVARDYSASVSFYRDMLGLRISDYIRHEVEPGVVVADATFFHTVTGRHHSLATAAIPSAKRINHIMIEVDNMNDVGMAYDRCVAAGVPFILGLGHHPNDQMFSFYVRTPSGFGLEVGFGGIVIDDADWKVVSYNKFSDWGHDRRSQSQ